MQDRSVIWLMGKVRINKENMYKWHFSRSCQNVYFWQSKWPFITQLSGDLYDILGTRKHICPQKYNFLIDLSLPFTLASEASIVFMFTWSYSPVMFKTKTKNTHLEPCETDFLAIFSTYHDIKVNIEGVFQRMVLGALFSPSVGWR